MSFNAAQRLSKVMEKILGYELEPYSVRVYVSWWHTSLQRYVWRTTGIIIGEGCQKIEGKQLQDLWLIMLDWATIWVRWRPLWMTQHTTRLKGIRRFVGMTSWYRRFINNLSELRAPITVLTKNQKFVWTDERSEQRIHATEVSIGVRSGVW